MPTFLPHHSCDLQRIDEKILFLPFRLTLPVPVNFRNVAWLAPEGGILRRSVQVFPIPLSSAVQCIAELPRCEALVVATDNQSVRSSGSGLHACERQRECRTAECTWLMLQYSQVIVSDGFSE